MARRAERYINYEQLALLQIVSFGTTYVRPWRVRLGAERKGLGCMRCQFILGNPLELASNTSFCTVSLSDLTIMIYRGVGRGVPWWVGRPRPSSCPPRPGRPHQHWQPQPQPQPQPPPQQPPPHQPPQPWQPLLNVLYCHPCDRFISRANWRQLAGAAMQAPDWTS